MTSSELLEKCREYRKSPTKAEALLWEQLRGKRLAGYKFRRQHPLGGYILDFYCAETRLGIEVDGGVHLNQEQAKYDQERTQNLINLGITVIRFTNDEVLGAIESVIKDIEKQISMVAT